MPESAEGAEGAEGAKGAKGAQGAKEVPKECRKVPNVSMSDDMCDEVTRARLNGLHIENSAKGV